MKSIFEFDQDEPLAKQAHLGQRSFSSKGTVRTHTHRTDWLTWTTKVVGKNQQSNPEKPRHCGEN